jgi:hypothetical protein
MNEDTTPKAGEPGAHTDDRPELDTYGDFRRAASWRIFRIMAEFIEGFEFLADLKNEVTFFGSARTNPENRWYKEARKLARMLGEKGYTIITGGGPGIMEAGNRGATDAGAVSVGLNIQLPKEQRINPFVKRFKGFYYFFTRKVMLGASAQAYVFFPGGFGTLDELLEMLMLIQTKKMTPLPIVLVGRDFWDPLDEWVRRVLVKQKLVNPEDVDIYKIVDSAEEAFEIVSKSKPREYF